MNESGSADRILRLEAAIAHLERNYDALNTVVIEQGRQIGRLTKRLEELGETLQSQEGERFPPHNQKPPHYSA